MPVFSFLAGGMDPAIFAVASKNLRWLFHTAMDRIDSQQSGLESKFMEFLGIGLEITGIHR